MTPPGTLVTCPVCRADVARVDLAGEVCNVIRCPYKRQPPSKR